MWVGMQWIYATVPLPGAAAAVRACIGTLIFLEVVNAALYARIYGFRALANSTTVAPALGAPQRWRGITCALGLRRFT